MRFLMLFLVGILLSPVSLSAANTPTKTSSEATGNAAVTAKLTEVLNNQKEILKQLADLKQELLIVKARATR